MLCGGFKLKQVLYRFCKGSLAFFREGCPWRGALQGHLKLAPSSAGKQQKPRCFGIEGFDRPHYEEAAVATPCALDPLTQPTNPTPENSTP